MKLEHKNWPISSGIVISWAYGQEFIDVDFTNLQGLDEISNTIEWWPNENCFGLYRTKSTVIYLPTGDVEISLIYCHEMNPDFGENEVCWGKSTFTIGPTDLSGVATWCDAVDSSRDGSFEWERVSRELTEPVKRRVVSKIERDQQIFRSALLVLDPGCVLTGETTLAAVDAAHIVPAKDGGAAIKGNGLLLRKDLHALYDAGYFKISPTGEVVVMRDDLSPEYEALLHDRRLTEATLARVQKALGQVWQQQS